MAYRDEQDALRARLEATELRLRIAEDELADATRRARGPRAEEMPTQDVQPSASWLERLADAVERRRSEGVIAGVALLVIASFFSFNELSLAVAASSFLVCLAVVAILSVWIRGAWQRLPQRLRDIDAASAGEAAERSPNAAFGAGIGGRHCGSPAA